MRRCKARLVTTMLHHPLPGSAESSEKLSLHPVLVSTRLNKVVNTGASLDSQPSTFTPLRVSLGYWGTLKLHIHLEAILECEKAFCDLICLRLFIPGLTFGSNQVQLLSLPGDLQRRLSNDTVISSPRH